MAQAFFEYNLTVNSRQYKRELAEATRLANKLAGDLNKSVKSQQTSLNNLGKDVELTTTRFNYLKNQIKTFPQLARKKDFFFRQLGEDVEFATSKFNEAEQELKKYQTALKRITSNRHR